MRISTFFYTLKQGVINIFRNKLFSLASIATISACLFLFGLFYAVILNFQNVVRTAEEGVSSRKSSLIRVDFPEPLSPTIKTNSPFLIVRLTLSKAGEPLEYDLLTRSSVMTASEPSRFFFFFLSFCTKPCHHPNIQKIPCTSCTLQP